MSDYNGALVFPESVYLVEETDVVLGGPDGVANASAKQLADRTTWLKNALRGYSDIKLVNATTTLLKADVFQKLLVVDANFTSLQINLPLLDVEDIGLRISMVSYNVNKQVTVNSQGTLDIILGASAAMRQKIFMGNAETIELIWLGNKWILHTFSGNFTEVGSPDYGYSQKPNTVIASGTLINRADYPRLWEYVQTLGSSLINDATWTGSPNQKGFFSRGNGTTTFRVPDLRSMFIRGLDLGAGISIARNSENPGGYEADEFKSHTHGYKRTRTDLGDQYEVNHMDGGNDRGLWTGDDVNTAETGGLETRPKNIGLIPLIKS